MHRVKLHHSQTGIARRSKAHCVTPSTCSQHVIYSSYFTCNVLFSSTFPEQCISLQQVSLFRFQIYWKTHERSCLLPAGAYFGAQTTLLLRNCRENKEFTPLNLIMQPCLQLPHSPTVLTTFQLRKTEVLTSTEGFIFMAWFI